MSQWDAILSFVVERIRHPGTCLTDLSRRAGVSIWWLHRIRHRTDVVDPGFTKVGRVFFALGGRAPKLPEKKDGSSTGLQD